MLKTLFTNKYYTFLLFLGITLLVFGNTFPNQWVYDDYDFVVGNPDTESFSGFLNDSFKGRPMRELTYLLDYKLFGNNPFGYHIQQLFWHGGNSFLLFLLVRRLTDNLFAAFLGVLLFLVHPLQSESVAHIGHRKELLPLFFGLASLLVYLEAVDSRKWKRLALLCLSILLFIFLLLSNVTAVTLPATFILFEYLFLKEEDRFLLKKPLTPKIIIFMSGIISFFYFYKISLQGFKSNLGTLYIQNGYMNINEYLPFISGVFKAFAIYVYKVFFPLFLAPEYSIKYSNSLLQWDAWLGLFLLSAIGFVFFKTMRTMPILAFGLGWFLIFYLPVSNVYPSGYVLADRYMYLCLPGLSLGLVGILRDRPGKPIIVLACLVLSVFSVLTVIQNSYWHDNYTLSRRAVRVNPDSTGANWLRANSAIAKGEFEAAKFHLEKVLSVNRFFIPAYLPLAKVEERLGHLSEALKHYEFAAKYSNADANTRARINSLRRRINSMDKGN